MIYLVGRLQFSTIHHLYVSHTIYLSLREAFFLSFRSLLVCCEMSSQYISSCIIAVVSERKL